MEETNKLKENDILFYKKMHLILIVIETVFCFITIPLQILKISYKEFDYPSGSGGTKYYNSFYNMWDNVSNVYMILLNILLGSLIIFNIICIIRIKTINKKLLFVSHFLFIIALIVFLLILTHGPVQRVY